MSVCSGTILYFTFSSFKTDQLQYSGRRRRLWRGGEEQERLGWSQAALKSNSFPGSFKFILPCQVKCKTNIPQISIGSMNIFITMPICKFGIGSDDDWKGKSEVWKFTLRHVLYLSTHVRMWKYIEVHVKVLGWCLPQQQQHYIRFGGEPAWRHIVWQPGNPWAWLFYSQLSEYG